MKHSVATVLATLFATGAIAAQVAPSPQDKPVEQTKAPEDKARDPLPAPDPLPVSQSTAPVVAQTQPAQPAAPAKPAKWDVNNPPGATIRQVPIAVDEGSWMDIDVSPDGRTIAFTLLGDIYTMPIAGGAPTRIAEGLAWEVHPRFSPDGRRIAFTSDRGGGDNIWVMNVDGSDKRQVTKETFRLTNQPTWSP
ncbi:MAG: amidohydrolase, partial [Sphingomonadales bacterium]|nr:amidohydrolase [Sphingomonadales bacterium]